MDELNTIINGSEENYVPIEQGIEVIDKLLSTGWTTYLDMSLALLDYCIKNGYDRGWSNLISAKVFTSDVEMYNYLMSGAAVVELDGPKKSKGGSNGSFSNRIKSSYWKRMSMIWTQAHKGVADENKINDLIKKKKLTRKDIGSVPLSEPTKLYLTKGVGVKTLTGFTYKEDGYSIKKDMSFCKEMERRQKETRDGIVASLKYNNSDEIRTGISPDPDVIERKVIALKLKAMKDALIRSTTNAIADRLKKINKLKEEKSPDWINQVSKLYLNALYEPKEGMDSDVYNLILDLYNKHMINDIVPSYFPENSVLIIRNFERDNPSVNLDTQLKEYWRQVADILELDHFSNESLIKLRDICIFFNARALSIGGTEIDSIFVLSEAMNSLCSAADYIHDLVELSAAFTLYEIEPAIDHNVILERIHSLVETLCMSYDAKESGCRKAEDDFVIKCNNFIRSLDSSNTQDCMLASLVNMAISFVKRDASYYLNNTLNFDATTYLNEFNEQELEHLGKLHHTLCFEGHLRTFITQANCDILSEETKTSFFRLFSHFFTELISGNIIAGSIDLYHKDWLISKIEQYALEVYKDCRSLNDEKYKLTVMIILIALRNKPYPTEDWDGCGSEKCKSKLDEFMARAIDLDYNNDEMQLLLLLLSIIALRNVNISCVVKDIKHSPYLSISKEFFHKMTPGDMKSAIENTIHNIENHGYFNYCW